ncbi:TPA: phage antirepressor [Streptococcus suis]
MNMELQIFKNEQFGQVQLVEINNEPWFIGKEVAEILGYERADNAIRNHVDEEDKLTHQISASGQGRNMIIINESGLYSLILKSKLPQAKQFKRWVTSEVLPAIRKHGMYAIDNLLNNPDMAIAAFQKLKEERQLRLQAQEELAQKNQIIQELQPKATYYDLILQSESLVAISVIAKDYGMSAKKLNSLLHELKVQFKQGSTWLLYQKYANKGYTQSKTHTLDAERSKMHTYWTQKGRLFIYDLLKNKKGILPLIEQDEVA